ncbi:glycoside hydrolase superfamily [Thelonectria olida]|uniref:glucan 1,3-beta-glucosidase n=1 Tax=Thelonectria olida TaxID=1576542 RepID=A0A9P8W8V0_9HYPO|nr:glycoside hydrolase superfamily [Thelonectria olida]
MRATIALSLLLAAAVQAWTPQSRAAALDNGEHLTPRWLSSASSKIRGVNLGSHFIVERWMAESSWEKMGCAAYNDEWACVEGIGQAAADKAFAEHWATWTTEADIEQMASLGLNAVRIPVGFWMHEDIVAADEHYPRGGIWHLDRVVGWCKKYGLYVIVDLHAAPGSQSPNEQFTGHSVPDPGFYTPENYERAYKFLEWMTKRIHVNGNYTTVGMLQVLNEPVHVAAWKDDAADMIENFYPGAYGRIQAMEGYLSVAKADRLHIQFMGTSWGSGDPRTNLTDTSHAFFDAHRYLSFDSRIAGTKEAYISAACADDMGSDVFVGEWSLSVNSTLKNTAEFSIDGQETWYRSYWAAQAQSFEKSDGWFFWSWKCDGTGDDWRWCYKAAVAAGVIPDDAAKAGSLSPC